MQIIYIGDEDKYLLFFDRCCRYDLVDKTQITHLDKNLVAVHNSILKLSLDYKIYATNITNALIITQENWNCPDFIEKEINRIFFSNKIRTNHIVVENQYTLDRIFEVETVDKNDRATNRFELMEID